MKLDFKKFKKTHEDENSATLTHPRGHSIKIAKKALDKAMSEQLAGIQMFADGGIVNKPCINPNCKSHGKPHPNCRCYGGYAKGGEITDSYCDAKQAHKKGCEYFYEGGEVEKKKPEPTPAPKMLDPKKTQEVQDSMRKAFHFADGGDTFEMSTEAPKIPDYLLRPVEQPLAPEAQSNISQAIETEQALGMAPAMPGMTEAPAQPTTQMQQPQSTDITIPTQPTAPATPQQPQTNRLVSGIGMEKQGLAQEAQAVGAQGKQEADAAQAHATAVQGIIDNYKAHTIDINKERKSIQDDLRNGHIDPNHFMNSRSDAAKVSTAIGLILGGIGGAMTGQENPALKFLNQQIDRDIEGQREDMRHKDNMLSALDKQLGNERDAADMFRIIQTDVYSTKMKEIAARSADPLAKARLLQASGKLDIDNAEKVDAFAQKQAIMSGMKQGIVPPSMAIQIKVPKELHTQAFEQLNKAIEYEGAMKNIEDSIRQSAALQTVKSRVGSPYQTQAQLDALNLQLMTLGKPIFGTLSEQEGKMLRKALEVGFFETPATIEKKIKSIKGLAKPPATPLLKDYGIPVPKPAAQANPNTNVMSTDASTRK